MSVPGYIPGDHWRICDVCGFRYRASQTFKRWDGLITCSEDWEPRHPQDFVRGRKDRQNAPDPRSEQVDTFLGPLMTNVSAVASAGATTFSVDSSTRFLAADHIGVTLDTGNVERHIIQSIPGATSIEITAPLGGSLSVGNVVINYSSVSAPSL
jgi:hypothetical protein